LVGVQEAEYRRLKLIWDRALVPPTVNDQIEKWYNEYMQNHHKFEDGIPHCLRNNLTFESHDFYCMTYEGEKVRADLWDVNKVIDEHLAIIAQKYGFKHKNWERTEHGFKVQDKQTALEDNHVVYTGDASNGATAVSVHDKEDAVVNALSGDFTDQNYELNDANKAK